MSHTLQSELVRFPGHQHGTLADYQEIYEQVAEHDVEGAEQAMIDHVTRANVRGGRLLRTKSRKPEGHPSREQVGKSAEERVMKLGTSVLLCAAWAFWVTLRLKHKNYPRKPCRSYNGVVCSATTNQRRCLAFRC